MDDAAIGIDFGTTNTVVALAGADGDARLIQFAHDNEQLAPFRSALAFHADTDNPRDRVVEAGPRHYDQTVDTWNLTGTFDGIGTPITRHTLSWTATSTSTEITMAHANAAPSETVYVAVWVMKPRRLTLPQG